MRFLLADSFYPAVLSDLYRRSPNLQRSDYRRQLESLLASRFGHSDFYSRNLRALGHEAVDVILNCRQLQVTWARQHERRLARWYSAADDLWYLAVFEEQIRRARPDVLFIHDMAFLPASFVHHARTLAPLVVGQVASPIDFDADWSGYDLVLSSLPHFVERFRAAGVRAEHFPLAFEATVRNEVGHEERDLRGVFVGSFSNAHSAGGRLLQELALSGDVDYWGTGTETLPATAAVLRHFHGPAWGLDMFKVLGRARVAVNRHIDVAQGFANNMRLYEATGMGACLLTDAARNLHELFDPDVEVVTYSSADECLDRLRYLLAHDEERQAIAAAGQRRTLRDHTYARRMEQLDALVVEVAARTTGSRTQVGRYATGRPSLPGLARRVVAQSPVGPLARRVYRSIRPRDGAGVSADYVQLASAEVDASLTEGWRDAEIPARQRRLVSKELAAVRMGRPGLPFRVAAEALDETGLSAASLLEVGCASGYYSEALSALARCDVTYTGVDYSYALLKAGRSYYPGLAAAVADAARLPFADQSFDVVMSAAVIMHMPEWETALTEMVRVGKSFCILHRTPVLHESATKLYRKKAYGVEVVELVFREDDVRDHLRELGVEVAREWTLGESVLPGLSERAVVKTYLGRLQA